MARVISIVNQKGGVGKTTTVINVGAALASMGKRVLLVDLDPQGNLSAGIGVPKEQLATHSVYFALAGDSTLSANILTTSVPNLSVVPADTNLAGAEIELVGMMAREFRLRSSFGDELHNYDFVLIDCPPSLGLLTLNALCASDSYLVPLQTEFFALQGLTHILRTTELVRRHLNPKLVEEGILLTMFDSRSNLSKQVYNEVRSFAANRAFNTVVPRRVRLAESTSHGVPGVIYDPTCFGVRSYVAVAEELLERSQGKRSDVLRSKVIPPDPVDRMASLENGPDSGPANGLESNQR